MEHKGDMGDFNLKRRRGTACVCERDAAREESDIPPLTREPGNKHQHAGRANRSASPLAAAPS